MVGESTVGRTGEVTNYQNSIEDLQGKIESLEKANESLRESNDSIRAEYGEREAKLQNEMESSASALSKVSMPTMVFL